MSGSPIHAAPANDGKARIGYLGQFTIAGGPKYVPGRQLHVPYVLQMFRLYEDLYDFAAKNTGDCWPDFFPPVLREFLTTGISMGRQLGMPHFVNAMKDWHDQTDRTSAPTVLET